jgi:hypothetical protein
VTLDELLRYVAVHDVRLSTDGRSLTYDAPTPAATPELLSALRRHKAVLMGRVAQTAAEPAVTASGPLSYQQTRMLDSVRRSPQPQVWNVGLRLALTGDLRVDALGAALDALVRRHESLRTRFATTADTPDGSAGSGPGWVQEVLAARPLALAVDDLTGLAGADRAARVDEICRTATHTPFDLTDGTPLRARLVRLAADRWLLVLVVHHVVCDGWALSVLLADLAAGYRAEAAGTRTDLDPPMQAIGYARWQRDHLDDTTTARNLAYWLAELADAPLTLDLPYDRPEPAACTGRGAVHTFAIAEAASAAAGALARRLGTTAFTVFASAMGVLLNELTGQDDVVLSVPYANRHDRAQESLVAVTANAIPLRLRVGAASSFADLVAQASHTFFAGVDRQLPTAWLLDGLRARRGGGVPAALPVSFAYQTSVDLRLHLTGLHVEVTELPVQAARGTLVVGLVPSPAALAGYVEYTLDRLAPGTVLAWTDRYIELLGQLSHQPDRGAGRTAGRR